MERFTLKKSIRQQGWWVVRDEITGIEIDFAEHQFNETQQVTMTRELRVADVAKLATAMGEIADWLRDNHYKTAMP